VGIATVAKLKVSANDITSRSLLFRGVAFHAFQWLTMVTALCLIKFILLWTLGDAIWLVGTSLYRTPVLDLVLYVSITWTVWGVSHFTR